MAVREGEFAPVGEGGRGPVKGRKKENSGHIATPSMQDAQGKLGGKAEARRKKKKK